MDLHSLVVRLKELANEKGKTPTLKEFAQVVSKRQITKFKYSEIVKAAGLEPNKHAQVTEPVEVVIRPPRILYFDIESSYMTVKTYSLKTDYISPKNIIEDWHLYSYAAYFEGEEDRVYYLDQRFASDVRDDRQIIEGLHHLLSEADWVVGHNIDSFDIKKFNTRAAKYDLPPVNHFTTWDTLKIARKYFAFSSNSLSYIAKFLNLKNQKSTHGQFPGDSLWEECSKGNPAAWEECELYNKQDVAVTQELFKYLAKYDPRINMSVFYQKQTCSCGNQTFFKNGLKYTRQGAFQLWRCHVCQKCFVGKENVIDKDIRKGFFK